MATLLVGEEDGVGEEDAFFTQVVSERTGLRDGPFELLPFFIPDLAVAFFVIMFDLCFAIHGMYCDAAIHS